MVFSEGKNVFKCRYCNSPEDLFFAKDWKKGDRPVRAIDGGKHDCKKNKKFENTGYSKKPKNAKPDGWYLKVNNKPSVAICGECQTVLTTKQYDYSEIRDVESRKKTRWKYNCQCVLLSSNWCKEYCEKCQRCAPCVYHKCLEEVSTEK